MVDMETYKKMHPNSQSWSDQEQEPGKIPSHWIDYPVVDMTDESPPPGDYFIMCLPPKMRGFDMNKKEWSMYCSNPC